MVSAVRLVAFLASLPGVLGQYACPKGSVAKTGTSTCGGAVDASCTDTSCCTITGKLCSATGVLLGNPKCKTDAKKKFYDLAKDSAMATSASDADFRAACCTDCSKATCADWSTVKTCGLGKVKSDGTKILASEDCSVPTNVAYIAACCATPPTLCSATGVLVGNPKCKTDAKMKFYDLAKGVATYTSATDADFRAACCTDCSKATCADWGTVMLCGLGKAKKGGTITLASADCNLPTDVAYKAACCVTPPILCSATGAILGNPKCKTDAKMKFYDLAKVSAVATSATDADFRAACCTDCSKATCADWSTVKTCGLGKVKKDGTIILASADCSLPTNVAYIAACCATPPILCSATGVLLGNPKCKTDAKKKFYDLAKDSAVATSASDADFRAACCTDCSKATCADWSTVITCGTGLVKGGGTIALASADCSLPTNVDYRAACCVTPMACSAYVGDGDASAALPTFPPSIGTLLASLAVVVGVHNL